MAASDILLQANKLYSVSETLATLAEKNAQVTNELSALAKSVRQSAVLLEVIVAVKIGPEVDVEKPCN